MQGQELLHSFIQKSSTTIHKKRIRAVTNATGALLQGKRLTLTALGRSLPGKAKERHAIRGIDRLLGNEKLHLERNEIYKILSSYLMNKNSVVGILVDWSCINKKKDFYMLRASLALTGRSYTIYQEIHSKKYQNSPIVEKPFLKNLLQVLPEGVKPIIITDAGFRAPWFKAVEALGFHWVGRIRNTNKYRIRGTPKWSYTTSLYEIATNKPQAIKAVTLAKSNAISCNLVFIKKEEKKGRKHKNRSGNRTNNNASNRAARSALEPWLLSTSLPVDTLEQISQVIALYEKRMQIEEDFRDTKSHQYGFAIRYSLTNRAERLEILLLIATLACFACWLIALSARRKKLQYDFQSNSIKHRTVLSITYLACRLIKKKVLFTKKELLTSLDEMRKLADLGIII